MGNCLSTDTLQEHRYPKNKVVPLDADADATAPAGQVATASPPTCKQQQHQAAPAGKPNHAAAAAAGAAAVPASLAKELKSLPALQQFLAASGGMPADVTHGVQWRQQLQQVSAAAVAAASELQGLKPQPSAGLLTAVMHACYACIQSALGPLACRIEQQFSPAQHAAGSTATLSRQHATWDSVTPSQLLAALKSAGKDVPASQPGASGSSEFALLGGSLQPLAQLVSCAHTGAHAGVMPAAGMGQHGRQQDARLAGVQQQLRHGLAYTVQPGVPAVNTLVSAMGLVLFKRVVLESQASLETKADALQQLASSLHWSPQQLCACCSPSLRALQFSAHLAAVCGRGEQRVKVTVRRSHAFWDALEELTTQGLLVRLHGEGQGGSPKAQSPAYAPCKLFPSFVDEWSSEHGRVGAVVEAGEGHGPRKEFFMLAGADAAGQPAGAAAGQPAPATAAGQTASQQAHEGGRPAGRVGAQPSPLLLVFNRSGGCYWYNTQMKQSDELCSAYRFLGWLMGQSLFNHAPLGIPLTPIMVLHLLLGPSHFSPCFEDLLQLDPDAAASIRKVAALPAGQLADMLDLEGLPRSLSAEQYTTQAVQRLLLDEVAWQAEALFQGFCSVIDVTQCKGWHVGPAELAVAIGGVQDGSSDGEGGGKLDLRRVFRVVMDDELAGEGKGALLGRLLWQVLDGWPREQQLQFVEFVTGTCRLPLPGTELLKVECPFVALGPAQHRTLLHTLPQAHTCDNLLELPNYWAALLQVRGHGQGHDALPAEQRAALQQECQEILKARLTTAITGCMGYGLDDRDV